MGRICQGDIFREIDYIEYVVEKSGNIIVSKIQFPLVVVLSQDCDLSQDHSFRKKGTDKQNDDKLILSVLVAPLYNSEHLFNGQHLSEIGLNMQLINRNKTQGKGILNNDVPRYHFIAFPASVGIVPSIIDFKHYFAVNPKYLKSERPSKYVCSLAPLYRESLTTRYASFLARIGLPLLSNQT
jgi:hypothetical protein